MLAHRRRARRGRGGRRVARRDRRVAALPRCLPELEPRLPRRRAGPRLWNGSRTRLTASTPGVSSTSSRSRWHSWRSGRRGCGRGAPAIRDADLDVAVALLRRPRPSRPRTPARSSRRSTSAGIAQVVLSPEGLRVRPGAACSSSRWRWSRRTGGRSASLYLVWFALLGGDPEHSVARQPPVAKIDPGIPGHSRLERHPLTDRADRRPVAAVLARGRLAGDSRPARAIHRRALRNELGGARTTWREYPATRRPAARARRTQLLARQHAPALPDARPRPGDAVHALRHGAWRFAPAMTGSRSGSSARSRRVGNATS